MDKRPHTTLILAMTADGKIADYQGSAARFGSVNEKAHLEYQVSLADAVLFGAGTLRAYGTTMPVSQSALLTERQKRSQSPQPIQIVASASGNLNRQWRFFQQPVPRWLITLAGNDTPWQNGSEFEGILVSPAANHPQIDWTLIFPQLAKLGLAKLAILGGGELAASLLTADLIDELWLTLCPLILGGKCAPTPVGGKGLPQSLGKKLKLIEVKQIEQELFLHYQLVINN